MERPLILVVDDDPVFRELMADVLRAEGFEPVACTSPEFCLSLAVREQPALILLDLVMPQLSGWQLLTRLRQQPETAGTPVIITTAALLRSAEQHLLRDLGPTLTLPKPFDLSELVAVVRQLIPWHSPIQPWIGEAKAAESRPPRPSG